MKLGLLISGNLGFSIFKKLQSKYEIIFVMTDKNSESIISNVNDINIPLFIGNPRKGKSIEFINNKRIDLLVSVNYLFLIDEELIKLPQIIAFNIHGSLLPKYRGRTPHVWAIINNEKKTGITAHVINEGCDTGDIIEQMEIDINENDTGADVLKKFEEKYFEIVNEVIKQTEKNTFVLKKQDDSKATYYGKRTPDDGKIDWNWQKERIRNWIRAQAYPYPGAFTYYKNNKIIIDEIKYSECGYSYNIPNGMIVKTDKNPFIKTPNGVIEITKIRNKENVYFEINRIFND